MIVGKKFITLKCLARVFFLKSFFEKNIFLKKYFIGNEGLYSIGKGM